GESDDLVFIFPWQQETILCFKRHSIYRVTGFAGDLSQATLTRMPGTLGLVGRHAACEVSGTVYFMSQSGVFTIDQLLPNTPIPSEFPVSEPIKPIIDSINWNAANLIRCDYRRDRLYFAVPLKNAIRNNVILVYNIVSQGWESIDTFGDPDFRIDDIIKMDYNAERRLYAIDRQKGKILLLEQGKTDLMGPDHDSEYDIQLSVMTRGYLGPGQRSFFKRFNMDVATWNPKFTVKCYPDMGFGKVLVADKTRNNVKYDQFGKPLWNPLNSNDDHQSPRRQDYSVQLPLMLGYNGVAIEKNQESTQRFPIGQKARYIQLKIENTQGYMNIRTIWPDAYEDEREPHPQT